MLSLKKRLAKLMCAPAVGRLLAFALRDRIPNRGCMINTSSEWVMPSIKASLFWGLYEGAEIRFVRQYLRPDLDVVELGSSIGIVASHIARRINPSRRLICVEANPWLLEQIQANVILNVPAVNLSVIHGALDYSSDHRAWVDLSIGARNVDSKIGHISSGQKLVKAPAITLSKILDECGIGEYTLVSDIEGSEAGLVQTETAALQRCRQLVIELHEAIYEGQPVTPADLRAVLQREYGFTFRDGKGAVCVFEK